MKIENVNIYEALRYMGYSKLENVDANILELVYECEKEILNVIEPLYTYKIFDLEKNNQCIQVKGTSLALTGNSIKKHLENCDKAVFMAVTISAGVDAYIRKQQLKGAIYGLIADTMASAVIEQACNFAEKEIMEELNYYPTWRFSPGYGDLPITIQKDFLNILQAQKKIGLTATPTSILLPRKSVTAIIGLSQKPLEKGQRGCVVCNMNKSCQYRKRGEHCGF